jgi:hypothetical protein
MDRPAKGYGKMVSSSMSCMGLMNLMKKLALDCFLSLLYQIQKKLFVAPVSWTLSGYLSTFSILLKGEFTCLRKEVGFRVHGKRILRYQGLSSTTQ